MGLADILSTPRSNLIPSTMQFPSVDVEGLKKKLKLKDRAREQGAANLPTADSATFDPIEHEVITEIEQIGRHEYDHYLAQQKTYAERAADTTVQGHVFKIKATVSSAVADFHRATHTGTSELYALKRAVIQTETELNRFRKRHNLERPPRDFGSKTLKLWVLVLLLAIEGVLNGYFLSRGSEFGLVGGVFQAILIAGLNIVIGVGVGRIVYPWLSYRNWSIKLIAALLVILYLALAFGFNLAVAHYRTAMSGDPFDASVRAYRDLVAQPFGINDLESWGLFVMGFIFSLFAAYDGLRLDDPYPGYGLRMRHNLEALEEYNERNEELTNDLDEIKTTAEKQIEDLVRSISSRQSELSNIMRRSESLRDAITDHFVHLQSAANALLLYYRNENLKHRTAPPPPRFNAAWVYNAPTIEGLKVTDEERKSIDEALKAALKEIPRQQDTLNKEFRAALDEYRRIDDLVQIEDTLLTRSPS